MHYEKQILLLKLSENISQALFLIILLQILNNAEFYLKFSFTVIFYNQILKNSSTIITQENVFMSNSKSKFERFVEPNLLSHEETIMKARHRLNFV